MKTWMLLALVLAAGCAPMDPQRAAAVADSLNAGVAAARANAYPPMGYPPPPMAYRPPQPYAYPPPIQQQRNVVVQPTLPYIQ